MPRLVLYINFNNLSGTSIKIIVQGIPMSREKKIACFSFFFAYTLLLLL